MLRPPDPRTELAHAVDEYRRGGAVGALIERLEPLADGTPVEMLIAIAEPYRDLPEVVGPLYERIVAQRPDDARALVVLATAYWMAGRGPDVVGELAARALAADPGHRGAWHLWALTESDPRARVARWEQVVLRFPDDQLARANLADNAASLAGAESDRDALATALRHYELLLGSAEHPAQREALERAVHTLRGWRL